VLALAVGLASAAPAQDAPQAAPAPAAAPPAPPAAQPAPAADAAAADFDRRISRMLSAAWLADLFVFTLDKDISDEGYESVLQLARRCASLAPDRRPAWDMVLVLADQIESGKPELAREARREALAALARLDPADDVVRLARIGDAIDSHPTAEARVRAYESVLAPQNRPAIGAPAAARLAYQLASLESRIGNTELFARWLGDAVKTDPSFPAAAQAAAGFFRMRVNDPAADVELLSIALDANPRDLSTWSAMLTVLLDGGAFRGAERIARLAIAVADAERRPETTYALTGDLATALWGSGQRDAALRELELRMGRLTDEYRRNIALRDPTITVERLNREFPPLPSSLSIAMLALNQAKGRTAEVASLVERASRGTDAEIRRAESQGAGPEEVGALELQRATTALLFAKDVSTVPAMLEKAEKAGALGAEAKARFTAMLDWRQGRGEKAMAALEPMRSSDPLARFVYASLLQDAKRLPEAANEFRALAQGAVGTSLGLLALDRLAQALGQDSLLTSQLSAAVAERAKALDDSLDRSLPRAIDAIVESPMRALVVDLEPSATSVGPYQPLSFRLRLRNDSRLPLAIGNDAPIGGKVTLRAAASRAGQNDPPELPPQPILIDRRLRLEPGASIDVTVDADLTTIGLLLNIHPLDPHLINVAFVTNPASATGGFAPGFMGTVSSAPPIQSTGVNVTEAWLRESLEAIKAPGSADAVVRLALLAHAAAAEDRVPASMKAEIPAIWDAVLKAWAALPDRAKAWVVAVLPKETPAMAPLLDAVRGSPAREVLSSWAVTRVVDPADPMLDVCRRSGDEALATFADATKWVLERRAKRAIEEVGIEADRKRAAPAPGGAKP
jgi:tetratricopeptide (TPR) repeat protein